MTTLDGMDNTEYNGWINIETWNTALWLGNHSKGMEQTILRIMRNHPKKMYSTAQLLWFADNLETYVGIIWDGITPDGHSLKPVDWVSIADSWIEAYKYEDTPP